MICPPCTSCRATETFRLNPLEKVPQYKCLKCKICFIPQEDRIRLLIVINQERQDLKDINKHGIINERIFEFWCRTNPVFAKYARAMLEETENICALLTPATTIDRDARRSLEGNEDGLNKTYRREKLREPIVQETQ